MFEQFFGLSENPFSLTPDPRFIYSSRSHDEALAHLRYWVEHREGFAMITGEVGTGKTTALFRLIDGMERQYEVAFLTNSTLTPMELLEDVCRKFRIELDREPTKPVLLQRLESTLTRLQQMEHGAVLIIDEAQNFDHGLLEEVRLLSNMTRPGGPPLLQIALVGQPELERKLSLPELRQLKQRIGVHYRIEPLSEDETLHYIHHRVSVAGGYPRVLFPEETTKVLFARTYGLPRELNQVASQSLLGAYVEDSNTVTPEHVLSAIEEMNFKSVLDRGMTLTVTPSSAAPPRPRPLPRVRPEPQPPETARPEPAGRIEPVKPSLAPAPQTSAAPAFSRRRDDPSEAAPTAPAPSTSFGALPPVGKETARVDGGGISRLRQLTMLLGAIVIVGATGFLVFSPRPDTTDELAELASETTIPKVPPPRMIGRSAGDLTSQSPATQNAASVPGAVASEAAGQDADGAAGSVPGSVTPSPAVIETNAAAPVMTPPPVPEPARFRLQVASLRDSNTAELFGRRLQTLTGHPTLVSYNRKDELDWYVVFLGSFEGRQSAEEARDRLYELNPRLTGVLIRNAP